MSAAAAALDALDVALQAERRALVENDADALVRANDAKLAALRVVEANPPGDGLRDRIVELAELNRANGALLTRRHREVRWALRHLGRVESNSAYGSNGHLATRATSRALGVG